MPDDPRDFIERSLSMTEKLRGRRPDADEVVSEFATYGLKHRATTLDSLDADMASEDDISFGSNAMRKEADRLTLRRRLGDAHERLRRAGR